MAKQIINIGATANDKSGDPLRTAFSKVNDNFTELYSAIGADVQIPIQTGNSGKYLTTNGTTLSWATVAAGGSNVTTSDTAPTSPTSGDLWYDTVSGRTYIYFNNTWVDASPVDGVSATNELVNGVHTVSLSSEGLTQFPAISNESLFIQGTEIGSTNSGIGVTATNNIVLTTDALGTPKFWQLGTDGNLTLPAGGDIVDSSGNSVLGGGSADLGKFVINGGNILATVNDLVPGAFGSYNINIDPGGESSAGISIPSVPNQVSGSPLQIFNTSSGGQIMMNTHGGMTIASARGTLGLGLDLETPGIPDHFHVAFETSNSFIPTKDLFFGDDYNYLQLVNYAQGVFIGTNDRSGGNQHQWRFSTDGTTKLPGKLWAKASDDGSIAFSNNGVDEHGYMKVDSGYNMVINSENNFYVKRAGGDRIAVTETQSELNAPNGVILNAGGKSFSIALDGTVTLPSNFRFSNSTGSTILDKLSYFTNDLSIDADTLTGTTINSGITGSSLTSVGTLTGLTSSGVVHITNTEDSTNADTGSLQVDGGAHITKNLIAEGTIYAGVDAYSEALTNPLIVASSPSGVSGGYSQVAILNNTAEASGDFQVMVDGYDVATSDTGWSDLGFAGSNFSDARYTITNPGDGYVFVSGLENSTNGGSLVLATDSSGTTNDIVFATSGFLTANEKMRLKDSDGSLDIASGKITTSDTLSISANGYSLSIESNGNTTMPGPVFWTNTNLPTWDPYIAWNDPDNFFLLTTPSEFKIRTSADGSIAPAPIWTFDANGNINLPAGGDIKDSSGNSVFQATYTLPTASTGTLGGVKVDGSTIVIVDGVISATGGGGGSYTLPTASTSTLGGVKTDGTTITIDGSGVISAVIPTNISTFSNDAGYLTSVTAITGNAGTATKLATARNINSVAFDGTGDITVTAAAGTLTGNTLNAGITQSSLTSVGTLVNLTVTNPIGGSVTGAAGSAPAGALTGSTLASGVTASSLTSVGTLTDLTVTNTITGSISGSAPAGSLTGSTLASGVTASSLTSVGTLSALTVGGTLTRTGAVSATAWGTGGIGLRITNATYTDTSSTGTLSTSNVHYIGQPTLSFSNATTVSQANTVYISNAPAAGTNATITAGYALNVAAGNSYFAGNIRSGGYIQSGGGANMLYVGNAGINVYGDMTASGAGQFSSTLTRTGNLNAASWGSAGIGLKLVGATFTDTSSTGTLAAQYINSIGTPTMAFTNATTVTTAATLYVSQPTAGTNATLTNSYAILTNGNARVDGNLTLPNLPAFRVTGKGGQISSVTQLTSTNWNVDFNQGSYLNGTTGYFTAPVAGIYQVNLVVRTYTNAGVTAQTVIEKNDSTVIIMVEWAANTTMNHTGGSTAIKLAVGDTLRFRVLTGSISFDANDNWSVAFLG